MTPKSGMYESQKTWARARSGLPHGKLLKQCSIFSTINRNGLITLKDHYGLNKLLISSITSKKVAQS